jgi:hypothetical protein
MLFTLVSVAARYTSITSAGGTCEAKCQRNPSKEQLP